METTNILRIVADDYDQNQRARIVKGEQIRAVAQGRDQAEDFAYLGGLGYRPVKRGEKEIKSAADVLLEAVLGGHTDEPNEYLASAYRRSYEAERDAFSRMDGLLEEHPAWAWMGQVRGVGPTLGAKLLARLDIERASNASSFWCYCGLATVPGQRWECSSCGYVGIHPAEHEVTGKHARCKHKAKKTHGPDDGIRAAQPRAASGEKRSYDAFAKKTLFLIASSFLKSGERSYYAGIYRRKVAYYERERIGWEKGRRHYSALRVVEKLFLSHLYEAWCGATDRDPGECYAAKHLDHDGIVTPAEVLSWEVAAKAA